MLPEVTIPEIHSYEQILARAKERASHGRIHAALVTPNEPDMLRAFAQAAAQHLISPVLIGDRKLFEEFYLTHNISIDSFDFIDVPDPVSATEKAAEMTLSGKIQLLVKGRILTGDLLKLLFRREAGFIQKDKVISHIAVLKPQKYPKLLLVTDGAVNVAPDLKMKLALIENLVKVANSIGVTNPRVALLSAVEVIYPQMPVTMEAAIIAKMWERGQIKGAMVDGPLSFDVAVDMFAAHSKGVKTSPVAGQADAMVAPNIETANGIYKAMTLYGRCEMGGVIVGGRVPIAIGSRSDTWEGKFNSLLLGVLSTPCQHGC